MELREPWLGLRAGARTSRLHALGGALLTVLIMAALYLSVNRIAAFRGVTVFDPAQLFVVDGRSLDSRIPYLPWTALIYAGVFKLFYVLPAMTYPKTDAGARELFQLYGGLIFMTLVACLVFVVCPAEMTLRAGAGDAGGSRILHEYNLLIRTLDRPFNTWPCLHVAQPALTALVVARWLGRRRWTVLLWTAWAALAVSTLTTKQHFLWDILTGTLLAASYWKWQLRNTSAIPTPE